MLSNTEADTAIEDTAAAFDKLVSKALRRGARHANKTVANLRKRASARVKILEWQRARRAQLVVERQYQLSRARDATSRSHSSQAPAWGDVPPPLASTARGTKTTPVPTFNVFSGGRANTGAVAGVHCHREFGENHAHRFKSFHLRAQIDAYENFTGGPATTSDACELLDDVALALPRSAPVLRGTLAVVSDLIRHACEAPATGGGFANNVGGGPAPSAGAAMVGGTRRLQSPAVFSSKGAARAYRRLAAEARDQGGLVGLNARGGAAIEGGKAGGPGGDHLTAFHVALLNAGVLARN